MSPLLEVEDLQVHFPITRGVLVQRTVGHVRAVDGVSLRIERGETYGLVGESGCGKSTAARAILRLHEPTAGSVHINGRDVTALGQSELRSAREDMQIVFQDPYASLNPRMTVRSILSEKYELLGGELTDSTIPELLETVGLSAEYAERYPHEFSGGQRQRIGLARALALEPEVLGADEPVSALDVSVQAQVLKLMEEIRERLGLSMVFITHDLRVAAQVCDKIIVMQRGEVVEAGATAGVFAAPSHAYTRELFASIPGREGSTSTEGPAAATAPA